MAEQDDQAQVVIIVQQQAPPAGRDSCWDPNCCCFCLFVPFLAVATASGLTLVGLLGW